MCTTKIVQIMTLGFPLPFYAPNFEELEGAYWFDPVCLFVYPSVRYAFCGHDILGTV